MGVWLTVGCYLVAFSPSVALFGRVVVQDPLRIILFVLGAFSWLLSFLVTSLAWFAAVPLREHLWFAIGVGIVFQEAARVTCFFLLKSAQRGLGALANPSSSAHVSVTGVTSLANSRHLLAVVCGLGMGVTSALFLSMNSFAAVSGSGVVGGLKNAINGNGYIASSPRALPLYWALTAMILSLLHVTWTVLVWDTCHRLTLRVSSSPSAPTATVPPPPSSSSPLLPHSDSLPRVLVPAIVAVLTHFLSSYTSYVSAIGLQSVAVSIKALILIGLILASYTIIRHEPATALLKELARAVHDWVTLQHLRNVLKKLRQADGTSGRAASPSARLPDQAVSPLADTIEDDEGVVVREGGEGDRTTSRQRRTVRT